MADSKPIPEAADDDRSRRCPMLGSAVPFRYCRTLTDGTPCWRTIRCWWEIFDVAAALQATLTEEEIRRLAVAEPPKPKINQLLDLIAQAQERTRKDETGDH